MENEERRLPLQFNSEQGRNRKSFSIVSSNLKKKKNVLFSKFSHPLRRLRIQQFSFILIIDYASTENCKTRVRLITHYINFETLDQAANCLRR
jgi:hypothetical protein